MFGLTVFTSDLPLFAATLVVIVILLLLGAHIESLANKVIGQLSHNNELLDYQNTEIRKECRRQRANDDRKRLETLLTIQKHHADVVKSLEEKLKKSQQAIYSLPCHADKNDNYPPLKSSHGED